MSPRTRNLLLAFGVLLVLLVLAFIVLIRPPAPKPLPNPNGYDDFVKAASMLAGDIGNASTLDRAGLEALISTNAEPLRLVRLGLTRPCAFPADSAITNFAAVGGLAPLKQLAHLLTAQGRLAETNNATGVAAQCYLDTIRFGNEMSRGGFMINRLVGLACEAIGDTPLSQLVPKLSDEEARRVITELEKIDKTWVPWDEIRRNENRFSRYQLRKAGNILPWIRSRWQVWRAHHRAEMRDKRIAAHLHLLTVELALRCYQSEQGHPPASLTQLVPRYLQGVPSDPFAGKPLIYRTQGTNWLLYSIGEDGVDDGGKSVGRSSPGISAKGDIFFDSPY